MPHLIFVYGTLKRGCRNHGVLRGAEPVGEDATRDRFVMVDLGAYPGIIGPGDTGTAVSGELYRVDDDALARLDDFEGVPELYRRERVPMASGQLAWAYLYQSPRSDLPTVPDGRWRD